MVDYLQSHRNKKLTSVYNQISRSAPSIMANIGESEFAQSRKDFVSKLSIALKEANETKRWLLLLYNSSVLNEGEYKSMVSDCSELVAMLVSSVKTAKMNNLSENDIKKDSYELPEDEEDGMVSEDDSHLPF